MQREKIIPSLFNKLKKKKTVMVPKGLQNQMEFPLRKYLNKYFLLSLSHDKTFEVLAKYEKKINKNISV